MAGEVVGRPAWLDFRATGIAPADLDGFLLDAARLRLESGATFGAAGEGFARMNLACPGASSTRRSAALATRAS